MHWGGGKPTTGLYDTNAPIGQTGLGFKNFGGQGQGEEKIGWKFPEDKNCSDRYMLVLVQSKSDLPVPDDSAQLIL